MSAEPRSGRSSRRRSAQRSLRTPSTLRSPALPAPLPDSDAVQHGTRGAALSGRVFSGLIVSGLLLVLFIFLTTDAFYVRSIGVSGLNYIGEDAVFRWSETANQHVFQIDPEDVRARLMSYPPVADAQVEVGWPPDTLRVRIEEREPALVWVQDGIEAWVDIHGRVLMSPREERPDLLRIETEGIDVPISIDDRIDAAVVDGARKLRELIPEAQALRYDPLKGLGFRDQGGWDAWFGSGRDMAVKILIYQALVADLTQVGTNVSEINLMNPDAPYFCERLNGC